MTGRRGPQSSSPLDPEHVDEALDEAIEETFPASDPIALCMYCPLEITVIMRFEASRQERR
jgi:hypothetical protein